MSDLPTKVTALLSAVADGDVGAADQLIRVVYDELHRVAHALMAREDRRGDLQTTVVVHEICLRLLGGDAAILPKNRRQLFAFAAKAMRQFLVDNARKRERLKRGGGRAPGKLIEEPPMLDGDPAEILGVHEALTKLRQWDPRKADIVEYRYFVGLTIDETAQQLELSPRKVDEEWQLAKAWLHRELSGGPCPPYE